MIIVCTSLIRQVAYVIRINKCNLKHEKLSTSVVRLGHILKLSGTIWNGVFFHSRFHFWRFCFYPFDEFKADVAKLEDDEITVLTPSKVVWMISSGCVWWWWWIGRIGFGGRGALSDCGREFANTIIVHNTKMIKFVFILRWFFLQ